MGLLEKNNEHLPSSVRHRVFLALLKEKSREDIKPFFHREATTAKAEAEQLLQQERSSGASRT
jgi:hypothetical protein